MFRFPRKLYDNLSERDLLRSPVWVDCHLVDYERWWYELVGEEWVRPLQKGEAIQQHGVYFERCTIIDRFSREHMGMVDRCVGRPRSAGVRSVSDWLLDLMPMVIRGKQKIGFWGGLSHQLGLDFIRRDVAALREILELSGSELFPLEVRTRKGPFGDELSVVIDGFYGFINDQREIARLDV